MARQDFDLPSGEVHLDGAFCSPLPRSARQAVAEAYALKAEPHRITTREWFGYPDAVRRLLSRVLQVPEDEVGVTNSTTFGVMLLAQSLQFPPGSRVLLGPDEFPSNVYPWQALTERGVQVQFVGRPGHPLTVPELEAALDAPGPVRVFSVGAVHYLTGDLHPLSEFAARVHERGGLMVVDGTQLVGSVDVDWDATGIDVLVTSGYKWMLGPYGTGAIWVRRGVLEQMSNVNGNWYASANARDFERILEYSPFPMHGRRLDCPETASFLNMGAFRASLEHLLRIGLAGIEKQLRRLQDLLLAELRDSPLHPLTTLNGKRRGPLLFFAVNGGTDVERLRSALAEQRIRVSLRSGRMRVSPGIWNDEDDVMAFAEAVQGATV